MKKTPLKRKTRLKPASGKGWEEIRRREVLKLSLVMGHGAHCMTCGDKYRDWRGISLSHKIPLSRGGKTNRENCILECYPCHEKYEKHPELRQTQ